MGSIPTASGRTLPMRAAVRNELGIPDDAILLAHVARVDPMKDHESFFAAMAQLPDLHGPSHRHR